MKERKAKTGHDKAMTESQNAHIVHRRICNVFVESISDSATHSIQRMPSLFIPILKSQMLSLSRTDW